MLGTLSLLSVLLPLTVPQYIECSGDVTTQIEDAVLDCYAGIGDCRIELSSGLCSVSSSIKLCPGVEISGASEQFTKIDAAPGITLFNVRPYGECQNNGLPWHGLVRLEKLYLRGSRTSSVSYGIRAENQIRARRLIIEQFTQGVSISADSTRNPPGIANSFVMDDISIFYTDHAGFYVQGGDANIGLISLLRVSTPICENPAAFPSLGSCAGIIDKGFLGNTYVAPATDGENPGIQSFLLDGVNARHALVGAYAENGQLPGYISKTTLVLGGLAPWDGPGTWIQGRRTNGFEILNELDPLNVTYLTLGEITGGGGVFWAASSSGLNPNWPLRLKSNLSLGVFQFDVANLNSAAPLRIQGVTNPTYPLGSLFLNNVVE